MLKRLKRLGILILILMFFVIRNSYAESSEEEARVRLITLAKNGACYYSQRAIPREVMAKLHELGLREFIFADPGEKYQAGDVVTEEGLPWRQITRVIKDGQGNCMLAYAHGGFALHSHILFFEVEKGNVVGFWIVEVPAEKAEDFIKLLQEGRFTLKYYKGPIPAICQY